MDFKTRKKYYNLCRPYEPLEPDDPRNIDIDTYSEELGNPVRGVNWADRLVEEISLSDKPVFKLFTGLPGSGKSTELKRMAERLSRKDEGNLFPVYINAEDVIDLKNPIDVVDIVSAAVHSAEKELIRRKGDDPEKALEEGYLARLWNWLNNTDVKLGKGEFSIPSAGKLVAEMKTRPSLRQRIRSTIAAHLTHFLGEAHDELELIKADAKAAFGVDGMVVVFDSLEKLRGISTNWDQVLESAEQIFGGGAPYVRLPVNVLYTVPAALTTRIMDVDFMPMIKVCDKEKNSHAPGIETARELIRRRIPDEVIVELFGDSAEERVERLICWSGGYPREIIQILQNVIAQKTHPIPEGTLKHIKADIANQYRMIVTADAFDWLASVAKTKFLTIENDEHRRAADLMLANHAVLRYLNDDLWFELHPAVYEIPGVQQAIREWGGDEVAGYCEPE